VLLAFFLPEMKSTIREKRNHDSVEVIRNSDELYFMKSSTKILKHDESLLKLIVKASGA
jgi:hypothetical protein